jgi:hypothetical protein
MIKQPVFRDIPCRPLLFDSLGNLAKKHPPDLGHSAFRFSAFSIL